MSARVRCARLLPTASAFQGFVGGGPLLRDKKSGKRAAMRGEGMGTCGAIPRRSMCVSYCCCCGATARYEHAYVFSTACSLVGEALIVRCAVLRYMLECTARVLNALVGRPGAPSVCVAVVSASELATVAPPTLASMWCLRARRVACQVMMLHWCARARGRTVLAALVLRRCTL